MPLFGTNSMSLLLPSYIAFLSFVVTIMPFVRSHLRQCCITPPRLFRPYYARDYKHVKTASLSNYKVNKGTYQQMFRKPKPKVVEIPSELVPHLTVCLPCGHVSAHSAGATGLDSERTGP